MRILVASPNDSATDALRSILTGLDSRCEVEAIDDIPSLLSSPPARRSTSPDLVLVDMDGASTDNNGMVRGLLQRYPETRLVALGSRLDDAYVEEILDAGALGYLPKSHSETVTRGVLRLVLSGGAYRPYVSPRGPPAANASAQPDEAQPPETRESLHEFGLTDRQIEVLSLAAQGKSNPAIARHLGIVEGTVKLHMSAIFKALDVQNRSEAVLLASRLQSVNFRQIKEAEGGTLDLDWLLPHMSHRRVPRNTILFRKGDPGAELCYLQRGTIRLEEIEIDVNSGAVFGEIGIFSPSHERTCTAVCATDVDLFTLTSDQVKRLYLLNPQFALYVVHLIAKRLMADQSRVI
ncbi:MAG: cyclic nucleotide-binding domain-containing protein [Betaproteobacteria bacterium]|nr:cyclic nucleotide-binding domain-containing protein [Betaproteobacteria bacterium]